MTEKGVDVEGREYVPRGIVIDRLARDKKQVRTFKAMERFMKRRVRELGLDPELARGRTTIANYMYGYTSPDDDWLTLFALAFELTPEEMGELTFSHSFRALAAA